MTDDAIAKALCDIKFSQIEGNGRKFRHRELGNSVIITVWADSGKLVMSKTQYLLNLYIIFTELFWDFLKFRDISHRVIGFLLNYNVAKLKS